MCRCCDACYGYLLSQKPHGTSAAGMWSSLVEMIATQRQRAETEARSGKEVLALDQLFILHEQEERSILIPMLEGLGYILTTDIPGGLAVKILGRAWDAKSQSIVYCPRANKCVRVLNEIL